MIELRHVTKRYGRVEAVKDISFRVEKGELTGFLGRNGAGKSTTMNMISGYLAPTRGDILVDGMKVTAHDMEIRRAIGYLPEKPPLYEEMAVGEYLRFVCRIKGIAPRAIGGHIGEICGLLGLGDKQKRLIRNLSKGYRQRVGIAQALVGNPPIIILDEPTVGLDPQQIIHIRKLIQALGRDHTVLLSSHILSEIAQTCQSAIIMDGGKIVAHDKLPALMGGQGHYRIRVAGGTDQLAEELAAVPGVSGAKCLGACVAGAMDYQVAFAPGQGGRDALFYHLARLRLPIWLMERESTRLEDIFLTKTNGEEVRP